MYVSLYPQPEMMKLIFAVLYVSRMMGLTHCYKMESFFYIYICSIPTIFISDTS